MKNSFHEKPNVEKSEYSEMNIHDLNIKRTIS